MLKITIYIESVESEKEIAAKSDARYKESLKTVQELIKKTDDILNSAECNEM